MKVLLMVVVVSMMMSSCGFSMNQNRDGAVESVDATAPLSEPATAAQTEKDAPLAGVAQSSDGDQSANEALSSTEGKDNGTGQPVEPVVAPVTEAVRKKAIALIGVVYPLSPDLIVEVEGGVVVDGSPAYGVYVGSPNEMTTTTMALFAVNVETYNVYLMARVSGQYELVASVPHMDAIDMALEAIMSSPKESSKPGDYLKAHPDEVQTVLDFGDDALPYLLSIYDNGDRGLRGVLALELASRIHQGLNIVSIVSPDARFRMETFGVRTDITAGGIYPAEGIRLIEQDTGKMCWSMVPGYFRASFLWSPDSRFVAVYHEARTEGGTIILDTENMEPVSLPTVEELQEKTAEDITPRSFRPDPYFEATRWVEEHVVEIGFQWVCEKEQDVSGVFLLDVIQHTTSNVDVQLR